MGTPLGPKYIPYTYMDPLGDVWESKSPLHQQTWAPPPTDIIAMVIALVLGLVTSISCHAKSLLR